MSKRSSRNRPTPYKNPVALRSPLVAPVGTVKPSGPPTPPNASLLDAMVDHQEYASIVGMLPTELELGSELKRGLREIEAIRQRPCVLYVGNVADGGPDAAVITKDDLPFHEAVASVPQDQRRVDVFLATVGGSGPQIARFVNALRSRFDEVDFLIPGPCMSAGTLFALAGDRIWMNPDACLGPIDPQVPTADGRLVPAQALLLLVQQLQIEGDNAMREGRPVPWSAVRIVDTIDKKDLGNAISQTNYSTTLATQFLIQYKMKSWVTRQTSGEPVTPQYRAERAFEIATALASHDRWKNHGHAISRENLASEVKMQIDHPDSALERAIRRTWALCYWMFDKTRTQKIIASANYCYLTWSQPQVVVQKQEKNS